MILDTASHSHTLRASSTHTKTNDATPSAHCCAQLSSLEEEEELLKMTLSPRSSKHDLTMDHLPPESQLAMKALNVIIDGEAEMPDTVKRADIGLSVLVNLEQTNRPSDETGEEIRSLVTEHLSAVYTGDGGEGGYTLRVYVVLASGRSMLNKLTIGLIGDHKTECLEWFLEKATVGEWQIVKAGRVGAQKKGRIPEMTKELCDTLIKKIGIDK